MTDQPTAETTPEPQAAAPAEPLPEGASDALRALLEDAAHTSPEARAVFASIQNLKDLDDARVEFLGKKGRLAAINQRFGTLSAEEKPIAGKLLNQHKAEIIRLEKERREALEAEELQARLKGESIDVTLPGTAAPVGKLHPVTQVRRQIEEIFASLGFRVTESPEVETEWVNFDALNFQPDHPARDMQDTFFAERGRVLRTHTSGNQIRTMTELDPPMAIISSGKVYRCDSDPTHSPMFHQMEGYMVGKDISMAHLKGVLNEFIHGLYGPGVRMRFRPSFFPFTEPSAEVDIDWKSTQGKVGKDTPPQWMEILGCGMIHPNVLRNCGIDPEEWSGFAFGLGLDRIAMLKFGIDNIGLLYQGDMRFLGQF